MISFTVCVICEEKIRQISKVYQVVACGLHDKHNGLEKTFCQTLTHFHQAAEKALNAIGVV